MKEDFLHYLWKHRRFSQENLQTSSGLPVRILDPGEHNLDAGPDFFNARIQLGSTVWAGNVEMHLSASDWVFHGHERDPAYDNVVLHVVFDEDCVVRRRNGERIPCLILRSHVPPGILERYKRLQFEAHLVPCQKFIKDVARVVWKNWLDRLMIERLEIQTQELRFVLQETGNDWDEMFYRRLAYCFGLKVNAQPFLQLARSLPLRVINKHRNQLHQLEALLFGLAGMLHPNALDLYPRSLWKEYTFLKHKYQLIEDKQLVWKFLRMRPANFPSVRIAQFASLLHHCPHLFAEGAEAEKWNDLESVWETPTSPYWLDHYQFDKPSVKHIKRLGPGTLQSLVINALVPALFLYSKHKQDPRYQDKAMVLLQSIPAESNKTLREWDFIGVKAENAGESQALLHLKKNYCNKKKCMQCAAGNAIMVQAQSFPQAQSP
ncbi:MAG: DUF2851 family protein [Saprospiraceae bacterium]